MRYLRDKRVYISGPIEFATGLDWRTEPKRILSERFSMSVFDPFADPKQQWTHAIEEAKTKNDYELIRNIAKRFVRKDLGYVDRSDILIAYLPHKVPTTGTVHEIIFSNNAKKPTLLVSDKNSLSSIPVWYFGFIPLEFMFASWDALFDYLSKVDSGEVVHERWDFVRGDL